MFAVEEEGRRAPAVDEVRHLLEDYALLAKRYQARMQKYIGHLARAHVEQVLVARYCCIPSQSLLFAPVFICIYHCPFEPGL